MKYTFLHRRLALTPRTGVVPQRERSIQMFLCFSIRLWVVISGRSVLSRNDSRNCIYSRWASAYASLRERSIYFLIYQMELLGELRLDGLDG